MTFKHRWFRSGWFVIPLLCVFFGVGCVTVWKARFLKLDDYAQIHAEEPFLKCHTKDGSVYVLDAWQVDKSAKVITGQGVLYSADRDIVYKGRIKLSFDKVALLETNEPRSVTHTGMVIMGVLTGASLALTALCVANPKACFGSCPTFYADDGQKLSLQAEAFSASVAKALESSDVDSLYTAQANSGRLELLMTNDALETHVVRRVRLLIASRPEGGRVFRAGDAFYPAKTIVAPSACRSLTGDCLDKVQRFDQLEYISLADGGDLAAREVLEIEFKERPEGDLGLVIAGRNSLLNTFLYYQALAYMGLDAGEYMIKLERKGDEVLKLVSGPGSLLGDVEVEVLTAKGWVPAGAFDEVGPIAKEVQMVRLPGKLPVGPVKLRLRMCQANWKIDQLALAGLGPAVKPKLIDLARVEREDKLDPEALATLLDPDAYLYTYPNDAYKLIFDLPEGNWEFFLQARGYYYEWIRKQWLPEKSTEKLARMLFEPEEMLKDLAPAYKKLEPSMEKVFWESRLGREGVR